MRNGAARQVYIWGHSAGAGSGDRYEGQFVDGLSHGLGRTVFSAGGNHKVPDPRAAARPHVSAFVCIALTHNKALFFSRIPHPNIRVQFCLHCILVLFPSSPQKS